ncbi:helix-turn-helix transcriptional regulator [Candidatus Uabimicrobium amorphum]|uniref:Helix-turn-helix domain-containing protein n=1 Tax=Uabimicrobium amorphum TaxID=2596890 RepID=A0A5S9INH8_UABAM|nr:helix-turn-helix domain-containing protein [Candidatus Uabimicrobium amorphum]BBM84581.1 hypothetical protein UABAM_02942 [Candidatus Uabimicrobium amorphum]
MEYITITKVAKMKKVSRATVYRWIEMGKIDSENFKGKVKVVFNHKLESIEEENLPHTLRIYQQRLLCLEELINERLRHLGCVAQKQNKSTLESAIPLLDTSKTTVKRKTSRKHNTTTKKRPKKISDKKRDEIVNLVKQALKQGIMKKSLDPKGRGQGVGRMLNNPQGTTAKKLYELEKNALDFLK